MEFYVADILMVGYFSCHQPVLDAHHWISSSSVQLTASEARGKVSLPVVSTNQFEMSDIIV